MVEELFHQVLIQLERDDKRTIFNKKKFHLLELWHISFMIINKNTKELLNKAL
jgi:hypothetical protein